MDAAAHEYVAEETAEFEKNVLHAAIVREVRAASNIWRQLGLALLTSILAPVLLGAIILFGLTYDEWFPTIRDIIGQ